MSPVPFWQYFDLITLSIFFVVVPLLVLSQRRSTGSIMGTISQSVAHSKRSSLIFSVVMTLFFPIYYIFIWQWVGPLVGVPGYFYYLLAFSALCEMVFVWAPATTGKSRKIHEIAAYTVGFLMYVLLATILFSSYNLSFASRVCTIIFLVTPFVLIPLMAVKKLRAYTFLYETIYSIAWLLSISLIAHS